MVMYDRSDVRTGHAGLHVERRSTAGGIGPMVAAKRSLVGAGRMSIVARRRSRRSFGVGSTTPKPSGRLGRTRCPSHAGRGVTQRSARWELGTGAGADGLAVARIGAGVALGGAATG